MVEVVEKRWWPTVFLVVGATAAAVEGWKQGPVAGLENHSNEEKIHGNYHAVGHGLGTGVE